MNRNMARAGGMGLAAAALILAGGCEDKALGPGQAEAPAVNVSGDWTVHRKPGTLESEDQCDMTFKQNGAEVSATAGDLFSAFYWSGTIQGTVSGTNVDLTWTYYSVGPSYYLKGGVGWEFSADFTGQTVSNRVMRGTWNDLTGRTGEWWAEEARASVFLF